MASPKEKAVVLVTLLLSLLLLAVQYQTASAVPPPVRVLHPDLLAAARSDASRPRSSTRAQEIDLLRRRVLLTGDLAAVDRSGPRGDDGGSPAKLRLTADSLQLALRQDAAAAGGKVWDVEAMRVEKALGVQSRQGRNHGPTENAAAWKPHVTLVVLGSDVDKLPTVEQLLVLRKATRKALVRLEPPSSTLSQADLATLARDATKAHAADLIIDMKHEEVHARGIEDVLIAELHKHWPTLMQGA